MKFMPRTLLGLTFMVSMVSFFVLLTVSAFVFRDDIFQSFLDPGIPYQTYERPAAPDYQRAESWAYRSDSEDLSQAAVFFIHPTTYDGGSHWNAPVDRAQEIEEIGQLILPNWAAPFVLDENTRLFAPYYRQASLYAFMNNREDSQQARLLAYSDVARAFMTFSNQLDEHTPFILVGVGQGALHGLRVLMDFVANDEAMTRRLAAAYLLEAPVPTDLLAGPLEALPVCESVDDIRCINAYTAVLPEERSRITIATDRSMSWTASRRLSYVSARGLVCVNPLLWSTSEDYAPERLHLGGAAAENLSLTDLPSPMANQTGAQCQNGLLMTERPRTRALRRAGRLGEDRRVPHFNLFYMDLKADAERRLANASLVLEDEARYAPPLMEPVEVRRAVVQPIDG